MIVSKETYLNCMDTLRGFPEWVIDVETDGLNAYTDKSICGVGIKGGDNAFYFPVRHKEGGNLDPEIYKDLISKIQKVPKTLIGYNIKFDLHFLAKDGLNFDGKKLIDVLVMVRLTEPTIIRDLDLTTTIKRSYGEQAASYDIETKKILRKNKWNKDFSLASPELLGEYCKQDVYWTHRLYNDRLQKIRETNQEAVFNLECGLTKVLYDMEHTGIHIDTEYAKLASDRIGKRKEEVSESIFNKIGDEFNINSTQQLGEIFTNLGITSPVRTPKDKESWSEVALVQIDNELAGLVRQYRSLEKLNSTYLEPYLGDSILHTSFCNWGTLTGRLSSREPNLQNIPRTHFKLQDRNLSDEERDAVKGRINAIISSKKGSVGEVDLSDSVLDTWGFIGDESFNEADEYQVAIRRLFVPQKHYKLVSFDYSQMEVRVFLSYLHNKKMDGLLQKNDVDFHGEAAKIAFNVDENGIDYKFYRQMAKNITFGVIYGIGNGRLANQLNTSPGEAKKYKAKYFANIEGSKEFINKVISTVETRGWIKNRYGRIYKIPGDQGYKGVNYLVQGTSADILNERIIQVHDYLKDKQSRIVLQVHDEIICEVHEDEMGYVPNKICGLLETNSLNIPLHVDIDICEGSWAVKKSWDDKIVLNGHVENYIDWD